MFGKNIKLKSSVEKSSTLVNGKVPWCGVDSCLWAWIISPSVDNSHDVKKLSWAWFEPLRFGVPNSSRTFDLDPKSLPVLIIIMIWNVAISQRFGMKGHEIRPMLTNFWRVFITGLFFYFLTVKLTEDWPRMWTVAFSISSGVDNNQLPTRFFTWRVSTALVPVSKKRKKSVNRFSTNSPRPPFSQLPAPYFFLKHFYKFIYLYFYDMFIFIKTFLYVW